MKINIIRTYCLIGLCVSCKKDPIITLDQDQNVVIEAITPANNAPNILLIIADDMGIESTPGYPVGSVKPNMPNLEQLVSKGITFENAWSYPVCSPTRASILTGKNSFRTGVLNAEEASSLSISERTLHSFLDEYTNSSYSHSIIGKWHLSRNSPERPTEMGIGYYAGLLNGGVEDYSNWRFTENGVTNISNEYITTKITDLAIDWIDQQNQPWFCWVAYIAPHTPFHLPPNKMHNQTGLSNNLEDIIANPLPYFHAMIESLDYEIGRLIENIPTDELDNTTILFIGDNGTSGRVIQAPFSQGKGTLYQGGIHVPLIVSGKNVTRINAREQSLINSSDLFATIAEMTGIKVPVYENSYSFNSLLTSNQPGKRNYNYSQILDSNKSKSGYTIRNEQFKLIVFENGNSELYDLNIDPYETTNLMERSFTNTQQTALEELRQKVEELRN